MKMSEKSYNKIVEMMKEKRQVLRQHMADLERTGRYKSLELRVGWDAMHAFMPKGFVTNTLYGEEELNDTHINTALKRAIGEAAITPIDSVGDDK